MKKSTSNLLLLFVITAFIALVLGLSEIAEELFISGALKPNFDGWQIIWPIIGIKLCWLLFILSLFFAIILIAIMLFKTTLKIILNSELIFLGQKFDLSDLPLISEIIREIRKEIFKMDSPLRARKSSIFPSLSSPDLPTFSYDPVTIVLSKTERGKEPTIAIEDVTPEANRFYGFDNYSEALIGKSSKDLIELIKDWMNEDDYEEFLKDQIEVSKKQKMKKSVKEKIYATKPIIFNNHHPVDEYRNRKFVPIIVRTYEEEKYAEETKEEKIEVLYLDIDNFFKYLSR